MVITEEAKALFNSPWSILFWIIAVISTISYSEYKKKK